jgi:hypothetical protein
MTSVRNILQFFKYLMIHVSRICSVSLEKWWISSSTFFEILLLFPTPTFKLPLVQFGNKKLGSGRPKAAEVPQALLCSLPVISPALS